MWEMQHEGICRFLKPNYPTGNTYFNKKSAPQGAFGDAGRDQE
jgi:hypothetical protein